MCVEDFERGHISLWKHGRGKVHNAHAQQHNCVIKLTDREVVVVSIASFLSWCIPVRDVLIGSAGCA